VIFSRIDETRLLVSQSTNSPAGAVPKQVVEAFCLTITIFNLDFEVCLWNCV